MSQKNSQIQSSLSIFTHLLPAKLLLLLLLVVMIVWFVGIVVCMVTAVSIDRAVNDG